MKTLITILFISLLQFGYSQSELSTWIENHPEVTIMEQSIYDQLDEEAQGLLTNVLIYNGEISHFDIENYLTHSPKNSVDEEKPSNKLDQYSQFIKDWLALNQHVKIVKQSFYSALTEDKKQAYLDANALVLEGEFITYQDIINY